MNKVGSAQNAFIAAGLGSFAVFRPVDPFAVGELVCRVMVGLIGEVGIVMGEFDIVGVTVLPSLNG